MPLPQLTVYRQDRENRALITLSGEIDLESAPLVRASLERCLRDGIRAIDVDLTPVTFCDCSGLNAFLRAAQQATVIGGTLRLHHPPTTLARILDLTDCGFLLGLPPDRLSPPLRGTPAAPAPVPPHGSVPLAPVLSGDVR
ncbi:STAS domain-containing protein [Streptomyces sp. NPDC050121]|uniref:STAS domain-containing protein n=1 Tax=Streptomyces sp. NPDC050121 TaxID=3365601 RepID=UPI0037BB3923